MSQIHLPSQHQDVLSIPATELAARSMPPSLFQIKTLAADRLATAKAEVDHIEHALNLKYAERAKHLRLVAGKDSGVVHFDDGEVRITVTCPKSRVGSGAVGQSRMRALPPMAKTRVNSSTPAIASSDCSPPGPVPCASNSFPHEP